jgi:hypothetical protein
MAVATGTLTVKILLDALAIVTEFETWVVKKCNSLVCSPSYKVFLHYS